MKGDYQSKIMKFSKDTIVKSMSFTCLDPKRVFSGCLDFEIDKKQKEIDKIDKKIKQLESKRKELVSQFDKMGLSLEIRSLYDETDKLFKEIFKLQEQYV